MYNNNINQQLTSYSILSTPLAIFSTLRLMPGGAGRRRGPRKNMTLYDYYIFLNLRLPCFSLIDPMDTFQY